MTWPVAGTCSIIRGVSSLTLLLAIVACGGETAPRPSAEPGPDTTAAVIPPTDPTSDAVQRIARRVPADVLVRRGSCPFECCTYRDWTAGSDIPVLQTERGAGPPLFTLTSGQHFRADSGNVHLTGIAVVAVTDSVADLPYWSFVPGDTLVVLDHVGEGHFNVWHDGEVKESEAFWDPSRQPPVATLLGRYATEWWVHVTTDDGRTGWMHADTTVTIEGADACGG